GVEEMREMKEKHTWSGQLLNICMDNPYELYKDPGDVSETALDEKNEILPKTTKDNNTGDLKFSETLITVQNRRTNIVEELRKRFRESNKMEIFDDLIQGVDKKENTVLHLVASSDQEWNITNPALKIMWHCKWFQYTKGLLPKDYTVRTNKLDKTAGELFKQNYASLISEGGAWFKDTCESCSIVAALLSGISFAISSNIPGGNNSETGKPTLKGRPAFDAFALCSIIGHCCSLTALLLFLSIPISRKEPRDFRIDLPKKLLYGISSLFLSIVAMFTAFCFGNYFVLDHKFKHIVVFIYAYTCYPAYLYGVSKYQLYIDLLRSIVTKVPETGDKGEDLGV
ncbi:putative ankyrin repeat protein, partial [Trifolium pratense]